MLGPAGTALDVDAGRSRTSLFNRLRGKKSNTDAAPLRTAADCRKELAGVMTLYGWGIRGGIIVGFLALMFTMVNVQIFGSAGHRLGASMADTFQWVIAWLLDPMASIALGVAILLDGVLARYDKHEAWLTAVKWFSGLMTWTMNVWPAVAHPGPNGPVAGVILHSLAPGLVLGLAEAAPRVRRWVGEIIAALEREAQGIDSAVEAERVARVNAEAAQRQREIDEQRAETQRIRDEQAAERKAEQDRISALRETEAKTRLAQAEATAAAERAALAEAEAAVTAAKAEADKQETARLRAVARAAGQGTGQKRGQRGGQRRGQAGGPSSDKAVPPDVSDLMDAGRKVAQDLANAEQKLTRSALVSGLRSAGLSCSTDRAIALLSALQSDRTDDDGSASPDLGDRPRLTLAGGGH